MLVEEVRHAGSYLVGGIGRPGAIAADADVTLFGSLEALAAQSEAVIEFTQADAVAAHAEVIAGTGAVWVLGTTGLSSQAQQAVEQAARRVAVVQAANFSPGVALLLELAARMGAALPAATYDAEILEMHHRRKIDAPSGTALAMGDAVSQGRGEAGVHESGRHGQTGPREPGAIGFAALRGGQIVGEHTLLFTADSEQIVLSHRALDRRTYASGAVRAALWTMGRPPGLYGMRDVLGA